MYMSTEIWTPYKKYLIEKGETHARNMYTY